MKILLTGTTGQLGYELERALAPLGEVVALTRNSCNLADASALRACIRQHNPSVIVNPAAYTAVDKAESEPDAAMAINGLAPGILGEEALRLNALVVHYSTDYVFDGHKTCAYSETDTPNPQGQYGKSKWAGEQALQASGARHLIFRTSWVYGAYGNNFAKTMLRLASSRPSLRVVADQQGTPTGAALLADATAQVLAQYRARPSEAFPYGLYHLTAQGLTSWHAYAQFVLQQAEAAGIPLQVASAKVEPIATHEYPLPAPRPANSQLDCSAFQRAFGLNLPPWQQGVAHLMRQLCRAS